MGKRNGLRPGLSEIKGNYQRHEIIPAPQGRTQETVPCAYQMPGNYEGDPSEEGRMRIGDLGPRLIIQWISKAWTTHELTLPVFYREALGHILCLEKFMNLIETNINAGITLLYRS
jgi:hypothetical protein